MGKRDKRGDGCAFAVVRCDADRAIKLFNTFLHVAQTQSTRFWAHAEPFAIVRNAQHGAIGLPFQACLDLGRIRMAVNVIQRLLGNTVKRDARFFVKTVAKHHSFKGGMRASTSARALATLSRISPIKMPVPNTQRQSCNPLT